MDKAIGETATASSKNTGLIGDGKVDGASSYLDNEATTAGDSNEKFVLVYEDEEGTEVSESPVQQVPERPFQRSAASLRSETDPVERVKRVSIISLKIYAVVLFLQLYHPGYYLINLFSKS